MSIEGNKAKRKKTEFRVEWLNTTVKCEMIVRDDATGIHKVKEQNAKLSKIYDYSAPRNVIVCKVCNETAPNSDFGKGKSWSEWKVDYLKRHLNHKHHREALSTLTQKRNLEARGGSSSYFTAMPTAEESEALKTPSREVKTLIDSVLLSVKLNSSILSCLVINNHMSKYIKLPCSWRSKNYGFEFLKSIDFVAREEVMQSKRHARCHTIIIDESNDISSTKMLILYIKYCTADDCCLTSKTVFAGIIPLARCDSNSIFEEIKKFYTANDIDIRKMVMFTSDGAAVMLGKRNGVAKLLQNFIPHITEQHCVAHREDLGIDDAWSKVSLMQDIETLVKTVYTMFSRSSVKKQGLQAIAQACGHKLISFKAIHDIRWLSRHFAIQALVRNYDVLLDYCKEQGMRDPVAVYCVTKLESIQIKAALFVLNDILTELSDLSRTFQKSDITPMEAHAIALSKIAKL